MKEAVNHPDIDTVIVALPNFQHLEAVRMAAEAGKAILVTKPLGRNAAEAKEMLELVEKHGVFHGYLEDLCYTPKTLKAVESVKNGALGDILWVRARETHPGPHSDWFWNPELSGGGAIGQFEVSWCFRGGMNLRDEVMGVEGTIFLNHFLRTGFDMYTAVGEGDYVAEKAESATGWLFPVGDEVNSLGYDFMFTDMFNAMDEGKKPMETFYDGYVVNAIMDACIDHPHPTLCIPVGKQEKAEEPCPRAHKEDPFQSEPDQKQREDQHKQDLGYLAQTDFNRTIQG